MAAANANPSAPAQHPAPAPAQQPAANAAHPLPLADQLAALMARTEQQRLSSLEVYERLAQQQRDNAETSAMQLQVLSTIVQQTAAQQSGQAAIVRTVRKLATRVTASEQAQVAQKAAMQAAMQAFLSALPNDPAPVEEDDEFNAL